MAQKTLVELAWPATSARPDPGRAAGWFENNYVRRYGLTNVRQGVFNQFVGHKRGAQYWLQRPWEDHSKIWRFGRDLAVFTTEPYDISLDQAHAMVVSAREHGLSLYIGAHSPHNYGGTTLVVFARPELQLVRGYPEA